jgi:hypothetical protein
MEEVVLLYASNRRLEGWVSPDVGGPVELLKWRSASTLEAAPMWVSPTHIYIYIFAMLKPNNKSQIPGQQLSQEKDLV